MSAPAVLLADSSACLRRRVLRELLGRPEDDAEVRELSSQVAGDPLAADLLSLQQGDGSWRSLDLAWAGRRGAGLALTPFALSRLAYLGFGRRHRAVEKGAEFLFGLQRKDGAWPLARDAEVREDADGGAGPTALQTAFPLRALAACGFASDPRAERGYEWLMSIRLDDGAWPTGISRGNLRRVAGYRRLAHSRWGCRSNTTAALQCLALHPERRTGREAGRGLDLLLGRETREAGAVGFEVSRLLGAEPLRGFVSHFARFDAALVLDLASRIGATRDDERISDLVDFLHSLRGPAGLWQYAPRPQTTRWLTLDILLSLARIDADGDFVGGEPRTPSAPYPRRRPRY